jgi:hypothetical protein
MVNGTQTIEEICECCGDKIADVHVSEITTLHPKAANAYSRITIRDASNNPVRLLSKEEFVSAKTASYIREGLMDTEDAKEFRNKKELKYGVRPEAMCSMSIDIVGGVTQSYCYKTTHSKFIEKYDRTYNDSSELETTDAGTKVGVDRKGNIIRVKSEKKIDRVTKTIKESGGSEEAVVYKGPNATAWWRSLNIKAQRELITRAQNCSAFNKAYGDEVKDMTVVARFKTSVSFERDLAVKGCR